MTSNKLTAFRADGGDISQGRIKEIADNVYGDEEKRRLAQRLLAAEAELHEHRKAAATPVAWTDEVELRDVEANGCAYLFTVKPITPHADPRRVIKLYAEPPAPVVPPEIEPDYEVIKSILPTANPDEYACCIAADMWNACRAAMLQGKNEPVNPASIDTLTAVLRNAPLAPSDNQGRRAEPAPVVADDALCVAQPCPRCGVTSTRPNGEHYCHVKTGSTAHE